MNEAQKRAIQTAIANASDNLLRAKMQREADPTWPTGNGETIDRYIAACERRLAELKDGL